MPMYTVYGTTTINVNIVVEADDEEHALVVANEEFEGLSGYAGNGGFDKIVGTDQSNVSLDAEGTPEFYSAEINEG